MFEFFNDPKIISSSVLIGSFVIFGIALLGVMIQKNLIKIFIALSIAEANLFLYFIGSHFSHGKVAPIVTDSVKEFSPQMVDPVPQAMILTTIVIAIAVLALALSYITKYYSFTKNLDISKMDELGEDK